jgi:hypothetical protein
LTRSPRACSPARIEDSGGSDALRRGHARDFEPADPVPHSETLSSGTNFHVSFSGLKTSTNSGFQNFNPAINSSVQFTFAQPLIRNRGVYVNRLPIMTARSRLRVTEYALRDSVMQLVENAENVYWDLVQARDNLRVQERALELANEALKRAQRELELGAMSPLDTISLSNYATAGLRYRKLDISRSNVKTPW